MMRFIRWHIEDLAAYVPARLKAWWYWQRLRRVR